MTKLTQEKVAFEWGDKQEAAFKTLKKKNKLCSAPILALPQGAENSITYCDASHRGLCAVLVQNEKVIAYASDSFHPLDDCLTDILPKSTIIKPKRGPEFTWEREEQFQKKYPYLFTKPVPSSSVAT
ncbi:putative reverse transcriptase domain-containing protein [Tanacetum coccineum]